MQSEIIKMNQTFYEKLKQDFDLNDLSSIELNKDSMVKYTKIKLRNWLFMEYFQYFEKIHYSTTLREIERFIEDGDPIYANDMIVPVEIGYFYNVLTQELKYVTITKDSPENFGIKIDAYKTFLQEVKINFNKLDLVNSEFKQYKVDKAVFNKLLTTFIKELIDIDELYFKVNQLFEIADRSYILTLMSFDKFNYSKKYKNNESRFFDFERYLNPIELREFPKECLMFHKSLKTLLMMQLDFRKQTLICDTYPVEYQYIFEYAEQLTEVTKKKSKQKSDKPIHQNQIETDNEYPKHIFLNKKAYLLFDSINTNMTTLIQVSFLYRIMAEKDGLIVVKDTPFRNWYNSQNYKLQLEKTTKILEQAKNADRMALYELAKELIINN